MSSTSFDLPVDRRLPLPLQPLVGQAVRQRCPKIVLAEAYDSSRDVVISIFLRGRAEGVPVCAPFDLYHGVDRVRRCHADVIQGTQATNATVVGISEFGRKHPREAGRRPRSRSPGRSCQCAAYTRSEMRPPRATDLHTGGRKDVCRFSWPIHEDHVMLVGGKVDQDRPTRIVNEVGVNVSRAWSRRQPRCRA